MAIALAEGFKLTKNTPDFERQQYDTVAAMAAVKDSRMPEMYLAYCLEMKKVYLYHKSNSVDPTYGKWRLFSQVSYTPDSIQQEIMPVPSEELFGKIFQYVGPDSETFRQASFYQCSYSVEDGYFWVQRNVDDNSAIPEEDIEKIFEEV